MKQARETTWNFTIEEVVTALREYMLRRGVPTEPVGRYFLETVPRGEIAVALKWEVASDIGSPAAAQSVSGGVPANGLVGGAENASANPTPAAT